jgi:hypothetical protein
MITKCCMKTSRDLIQQETVKFQSFRVSSIPWACLTAAAASAIQVRPWKDHFKSDLISVQDLRLKNDLRSDQNHIFWKNDLDIRSLSR